MLLKPGRRTAGAHGALWMVRGVMEAWGALHGHAHGGMVGGRMAVRVWRP